jgi:hypothetical protein
MSPGMNAIKSRAARLPKTSATFAATALAFCAITAAAGADRDSPLRAGAEARADVSTGTAGSAVAHCPAGKVISGGFAAPGFSKESSPVVRVNSEAVGKRDWKVDAVSFGDGGDDDQESSSPATDGSATSVGQTPTTRRGGTGEQETGAAVGTVVSYAYCAKLRGRIRVKRATAEVQPRTLSTATARCGRGQRVIAGGFSSPGFGSASTGPTLVLTSRKEGSRAWVVQGAGVGPDDDQNRGPGAITAIAYCAKHAPRLVERSQQASVGPDQLRTIDVGCPAGGKAISGGFDANASPLGEDFSASGAIESFRMRGASGWTTSAVGVDDGIGATMTGFAYCAKFS